MGRTIAVITATDAGEKGLFGNSVAMVQKNLDVDKLKTSIRDLAGDLAEVFASIESHAGFRLNAIEVGVEISSEGGVVLVGTAKVGGKAAVNLKFERA